MIAQRKCACGGECEKCQEEKLGESQHAHTRLAHNPPGDVFGQAGDLARQTRGMAQPQGPQKLTSLSDDQVWAEFAKSKSPSFPRFPSPTTTPATDPDQLRFKDFSRLVTTSNLLNWAEDETWNEAAGPGRHAHIIRLLQHHQDAELAALFEYYFDNKVKAILGSHGFVGSDVARSRWAEYLNTMRTTVIADLHQRAIAVLVQEIKSALLSGAVPSGANLVKAPAFIEAIEKNPEKNIVDTGYGGTATIGFIWARKRIVSTTMYGVVFEVLGHEGIYFELSGHDFKKTQPFLQQYVEAVNKGTAGIAVAGAFIKGFLTALASPVVMAADIATKVIDMVSLAAAVGVKWTTGREISYTCLSTTCQNYNACLKTPNKSPDKCKSDAFVEALEQATIIIPLYQQGVDCLGGDAEACGSIASLSIGLVEEGATRLAKRKGVARAAGRRVMSKGEFEDAAIREAIDRPRAEDPEIAKALEKPKIHEEPAGVKAPKQEEPGTAAKTGKDAIKENAVHESARQAGSEVKLSDSTHAVAAFGEGDEAGLTFCSEHCTLVRKYLGEVLKVLPENYPPDTLRELNYLRNKARGIDRELAKRKISREVANRASHEIAGELAKYAKLDPNLNNLFQLTSEELEANRAQLRKDLRRTAARARDVADEFREREEGARTQNVKPAERQFISDSALERDVMDEMGITDMEDARRTPGGARQPEHFDVGNFGHTYAEELIPGLQRGLDREVQIKLPDGTVRRADRVHWNRKNAPGAGGTVYEIKPNTGRWPEAGRRQAEIYARYMHEIYGGDWRAECVTYNAAAVRGLVRRLRRR
jgi:hypothetical protein